MKKNPMLNPKPLDPRPQFNLWAPGDYLITCYKCGCAFQGDKCAKCCADCAYGCTMKECAEPAAGLANSPLMKDSERYHCSSTTEPAGLPYTNWTCEDCGCINGNKNDICRRCSKPPTYMTITKKEYEELLADRVTLETIFKGMDRLIYGSVNNAKAFRKQLKEEKERDIYTCPNCGGPADNGFNREIPPSPYWCSRCEAIATRNMKDDENE